MSVYNDPRWIKLRNSIRKRDNFACRKCGTKNKILHVHHTKYIIGRPVWNIPAKYLITLCEDCHEKEHKEKKITEFYKEATPKEIRKEKKRVKKLKKSKLVERKKPIVKTKWNTSWFDMI